MDIIGIKPGLGDHEYNFKKVGAIPNEPFWIQICMKMHENSKCKSGKFINNASKIGLNDYNKTGQ